MFVEQQFKSQELLVFFWLHIAYNITCHLMDWDLLDFLDISQDILRIIRLNIFVVFNDINQQFAF